MVKIVLGAKAKNSIFDIGDIGDIDLQTLKGTDPQYSISKNGDVTVSENKFDYVILSGSFNMKGFASGSYADGIKRLDAITVVEDGRIQYKASGLGITGADVESGAAFKNYLAEKGFGINGNNFANDVTAGNLKDVLHGLSGNDNLYGMGGVDKLYGDDGNDRVVGGRNNDVLTGGKGADVFEFLFGDGNDVIVDFQARGRGQDHIDLSGHIEVSSFADLEIVDAGKNVVITVGDDTITLKNVNHPDVGAPDFLF